MLNKSEARRLKFLVNKVVSAEVKVFALEQASSQPLFDCRPELRRARRALTEYINNRTEK